MPGFLTRLATIHALGWANVARVALYRALLRLGRHPAQKISAAPPAGPFFDAAAHPDATLPANAAWVDDSLSFGWYARPLAGAPPRWHENPFTGASIPHPERPWWTIPDFDPAVGDIKTIWEASRFGWAIGFAQQARRGDAAALSRLNRWIADWCRHNPPYSGPNWKCGQESSLRLLHLATCALLLDSTTTTRAGLLDFVAASLARIEPTRAYAIAQSNNHGTSEAAALFIGGSWLAANGRSQGQRWADAGRTMLEERVNHLIAPDGSFSQYSLVYHRLMLDTLSLSQTWARRLNLPAFSDRLLARARAATLWLHTHVDPASGDVPNIGANDGAHILDLTHAGYRDFRPSVQWAAALFCGQAAYAGGGAWNAPLDWLGLSLPDQSLPAARSTVFDDGGFAALRRRDALACLRYPRFRFRPSQADMLHTDLFVHGVNHLADAGTYSYGDESGATYFAATASHNTVTFDDRDQMPRLGRFLFGGWLKTQAIQPLRETSEKTDFAAAYRDARGASHQRTLSLADDSLAVTDTVAGFKQSAVLRWRLLPGKWVLDGTTVKLAGLRLAVIGDIPIIRFELVSGWESRYYLRRTTTPVLEVEIASPGTLHSLYTWQA